MDPLSTLPGAQEQGADQGAETSYPHPFCTAGAELTRSGSSPSFFGQYKNITVEKKKLHCKRARHSELFKSPADLGKSGQGEESEGAANGEDASGDNREK